MNRFLICLVCGFVMFACSKKEPQPTEEGSGKVIFEISAGTQLSEGYAKSAVYSQAPDLHVTDVKVYAFRSDGTDYLYVQTFIVPDWNEGLTFKRYVIAENDELPAGTYKFLAVGRNASDKYVLTDLSPTARFEDMQARVAASGDEDDIYAGVAQADVAAEGARVNIVMKRPVAGVLGYFKNIPQILDGKTVQYLRLTASNTNMAVNLTDGSGIPSVPAAYHIIDIDLSGQSVSDGMYTGNDLTAKGVVKLPNSQLSGAFIIPVSGTSLTLGLYEADGTPVKTWLVMNGASSSFALIANNLYTLGRKMQASNTDNGTPDPKDDDDAIDLLNDQAIAITISPAWEIVDLVFQ